MIEPTKPDLAEAVRRPSAAEQLAARVAGQAHCPVLLCTHTAHRFTEEGIDLVKNIACDKLLEARVSSSASTPPSTRSDHTCALSA